MDYNIKIKVPQHLRVNVVTPKGLGDNPTAVITSPKNVPNPTNVVKIGENQYEVIFAPSSVGETVSLTLSSVRVGLFKSLLSIFTLVFWLNLFPNRQTFTSFSFKIFFVRSLIASGFLFVSLVGLQLSGVNIHQPFMRWLNTMDMVENTVDKIRQVIGMDETDPFFQSKEALAFYSRTGQKLSDVYLMTYVIEEDKKYRLLVKKDFFPADDLDAAEDICEKELNAVVPGLRDYHLLMKNVSLVDNLKLSFAEWTTESRGMMSDDYMLFVSPDDIKAWQMNIESIKNGDSIDLDEIGGGLNVDRDEMNDQTYVNAIIKAFNNELRLPVDVEVEYEMNIPFFYLDADSEANFRCVRRLTAN